MVFRRLINLAFYSGKKRLVGILSIMLLLIAIPLTVFVSQKQQEIRQRAEGKDLADLDVTYIERTPRYDYDSFQGWPSSGENVTFTAHIKNKGSIGSGTFDYQWLIDNVVVKSGTIVNIDPGNEETQIYNWVWTSGSHKIKLIADYGNIILEKSERNNSIEDNTNALAIGFWVEKSVYDYFNNNQLSYCLDKGCVGSNSWEDWAQRQLKNWNSILESGGASDRVRLDKIVIVDDCRLPLSGGGIADNYPDLADKTPDIMWGFTSGKVGVIACARDQNDSNKNLYQNNPQFQDAEWPLIHEMSHARYLIHEPVVQPQDVHILDDDDNLISSTFMNNNAYWSKYADIMIDQNDPKYSVWSIGALNRIAGKRNKGGNYNSSSSIGEYLYDLPMVNYLKILSSDGQSLANIKINIYQASNPSIGFDNIPDITGTTDQDGVINIGKNPFGDNLLIDPITNIIIVKIKSDQQAEFNFVEIGDFNLAYWAGNTQSATYEIKTKISKSIPPISEISPSPTLTPVPQTPTVPPSPTVTPIPTPAPGDNLAVFSSINFGGILDVNSTRHHDKNIAIYLYGATDDPSKDIEGRTVTPKNFPKALKFNAVKKSYESDPLNIGNIPDGTKILIKIDKYLRKNIQYVKVALPSGTFAINISSSNVDFVPGDIDGDNEIDIKDYNIIAGCFGNKSCGNKDMADLNEDGIIDGIDYNIFLKSLSLTSRVGD